MNKGRFPKLKPRDTQGDINKMAMKLEYDEVLTAAVKKSSIFWE
jgi:hypothetical protein